MYDSVCCQTGYTDYTMLKVITTMFQIGKTSSCFTNRCPSLLVDFRGKTWLLSVHMRINGMSNPPTPICPKRILGFAAYYHLVMTNIAMEFPNHKWRFRSLGKSSISIGAIYTTAMLVITRGYIILSPCFLGDFAERRRRFQKIP